mmetsp:Transcript_20612/g.63949  ORF Transcript_20612/g.63949 Transcript_20612/m.63949 type:complete len:228 (+) Transcript_20612:877-1560(+)
MVGHAKDGPADVVHHVRSKHAVRHVNCVEQRRHQTVDHRVEVVGHEARRAAPRRRLVELLAPQALHQRAGVDTDGALLLAHAVRGARLLGVVHVHVLKVRQLLALLAGGRLERTQAVDLAEDGDALPRRERDVARGAVGLAEPALNAAVHDLARGWRQLKALAVDVRVVVEDDARVEHVVRVEELLELPHDVGGFATPLHLHERRHVAPRAVLGLERAAVLLRHDLA